MRAGAAACARDWTGRGGARPVARAAHVRVPSGDGGHRGRGRGRRRVHAGPGSWCGCGVWACVAGAGPGSWCVSNRAHERVRPRVVRARQLGVDMEAAAGAERGGGGGRGRDGGGGRCWGEDKPKRKNGAPAKKARRVSAKGRAPVPLLKKYEADLKLAEKSVEKCVKSISQVKSLIPGPDAEVARIIGKQFSVGTFIAGIVGNLDMDDRIKVCDLLATNMAHVSKAFSLKGNLETYKGNVESLKAAIEAEKEKLAAAPQQAVSTLDELLDI